MEYFLLFVIFAGICAWLIQRSSADRGAVAQLRYERNQLERRVTVLEGEVELLKATAPRVETGAMSEEYAGEVEAILPPPLPVVQQVVQSISVDDNPPARDVPAEVENPVEHQEPIVSEDRPRFIPPIPRPVAKPVFNWEQFVGVKLFSWLGGLALFFAAALGLKYSFDHDLVPPVVRAAGGFLLGAGLLFSGVLLKRKQYMVTAQTLCATGVVVLYAVTFACRAFYHFSFFGPVPTFLLMTLITATAFLLAVRMDGQVVAILGMLGGFLTPVLLSTGEDNSLGLFGYVALLDLGLMAVTHRKRWDYLAILAAGGTVAMQIGWFMKFYSAEKIYIAQGVFLGFPVLFLGLFIWANKRDWMNQYVTGAAALLAIVALAVSFNFALSDSVGAFPGRTFCITFGADLVLLAMVALRPRLRKLETLGGSALFILLSCWTLSRLAVGEMYWALGMYLLFAVMHTGFPLALKKLRPDETPTAGLWSQFIPAAALLLAMLPIVRELTVPWLFWAVVFLVDVLATIMALVAGAVLGLLAVLVFTVAATAIWLSHSTSQAVDLSEGVVVIGGFALFFFAASAFVWRKMLSASVANGLGLGAPGPGTGAGLPFDVRPLIPALSGVLPFLLLIMVVAQFKPVDPSSVFGLAALLLALIFGLAKVTRYDSLLAVGLVSVALLETAWFQSSHVLGHSAGPLAWFLGFYAAITAYPFVFQRSCQSRQMPWAVAAMAGPIQFGLVYHLVKAAYPTSLTGLLPAAFAAPALLGLFRILKSVPKDEPKRLTQLAWFGGVALFFITLIFPIQFDKQWITVAWALEGMALCWLFHRVPHPGLRVVGLGLLATAFLRLTLNASVFSYYDRSATPILNWFLYTYATVAVCHFVAARLLAPPRDVLFGVRTPPILCGLGGTLAFLLLNIEIADYFSAGRTITFEFSGNFARGMTYTVAWALFAFVLLLLGIWKRARLVRYTGLGLLGVSLAKLFLYDLANLNQLYRIGAFAAVAIIAIVASFLYQRFLSGDSHDTEPDSAHEKV